MIEKNELFIPPTLTFKSCAFDSQPYFLVKDEIFPLKTELLRTYIGKLDKQQRIFD